MDEAIRVSLTSDKVQSSLTDAQRAYVAATALCLLWYADVEDNANSIPKWWVGFANEQVAREFLPIDVQPDELFTDAFYRARHEDDRKRCDLNAQEHFRRGEGYSHDYRCRMADGSIRWLHDDVRVETVAPGKWRAVGLVTDVTGRRAIEEALRLSERRHRELIDSLPQIAWVQAAGGEVLFLNRRFFELTGTAQSPSAVPNWLEIVAPADVDHLRNSYHEALTQHRAWEGEMRLRMADGEYRWFLTRLVPILADDGTLVNWLGTATDVHSRKSAEEELELRVQERTHELVSAYDEMEAFNYSVSHDLRSPARAIHFACSVLLAEHREELSSLAREELERAIAGATRMGRLIDDLLQYSRLNRREVIRTEVDLTFVARLVIDELTDRGSTVIDLQDDMIDEVDPGLARLVFQNLIENAVKFSSRTPNARVEVGRNDQGYFVRDNGAGFDGQYVEKLFQPFQRLHRVDEYPGTGIGLANVRRIVERHGGRVWAEGTVNHGATFWFTLHPDASFKIS